MSNDSTPELERRTPSKVEALDFTDRFREAFDTFCDSAEEISKFLKESLETDYWKGAGYDSWKEWYETEYADHISFLKEVKLGIDTRADIIQSLADGGLTKKEIASTVGVSTKTVHRTLTLTEVDHGTNVPRSSLDDEETAGQSVDTVGHIDDHSESLQTVEMRSTTREEEAQQNWNDDKADESKPDTSWLDSIDFSAMVIPVPEPQQQIIEAEPSEDTEEYFTPRPVAPSWSPPQVRELPPPQPKRYDDDEPEFLAPPLKAQKVQDPTKDNAKHCRTCNCNLLP